MSARRSIDVAGYSHGNNPIPVATRIGQLIASGGIHGMDVTAGTMSAELGDQLAQMFRTVGLVLAHEGLDFEAVLRLEVTLASGADRNLLNQAWVQHFPDPASRPARHVTVRELPGPMLVQCQFLASSEASQPGQVSGDDPLVDRLARLDTPAVSDALDQAGISGVLKDLSALGAAKRFAGRAITVKLGPADGTPASRHLCTAAVDASGPGKVIVVDNNGRTESAAWGGLLALGTTLRGASGVVVDGLVRDLDECREFGLALHARGATPVTARGRVVEKEWNTPVSVAGVPVSPGDLILGDASGVLAIPAEHGESIVAAAERIVAREKAMAAAARSGLSMAEVMGASYETMLDEGRG